MSNVAIMSDLDGVLVDTYAELQDWIWHRFHVWVPLDAMTDYDVRTPIANFLRRECVVDVGVNELGCIINNHCWNNPLFYDKAKPVTSIWQALLKTQARVFFATARPVNARLTTLAWLARYGFWHKSATTARTKAFVDLAFTQRKDLYAQHIANTYNLTQLIIVDDRPSIIQSVCDLKDSRLKPFLVSYPWTRSTREKQLKRFIRTSTWLAKHIETR